ncbi:ABC transporter ATP-binding protein [Herbaspirillum autotrophicum]|uniref:ABC transporter ATP-binding protein n=1 Tax=Herbaspirillum autotrophicum TaxID=180195 RepID=UPI00067CF3AC|nr:ABC transporter ATP-binding protein [Herbaspirillum autotrophicum]
MLDLLSVNNLTAGYRDAVVIDDLSLDIARGEAVSLLGRNGVGKSTLLASLMGLTTVSKGSIAFGGKDIGNLPSYQRNRKGLGYVPQEREIFPSLTVEQNLRVAARPGEWDIARIYALFPRLQERRGNYGNQLSGGEQQMLSMARALVGNPALLLLDEPLEGLSPIMMDILLDAVKQLKQTGLTLILVEQHAHLALEVTDRVVVLDRGRIIHQGRSDVLLQDEAQMHCLLGLAQSEAAGDGSPPHLQLVS